MAHLFQPEYTRPIPPDAQRVAVKEVPCVRWKSRGGKVVTAPISTANPNRCRVRIPVWWIRYEDSKGRTRKKKAYTDRAASEGLLAEVVSREARIAAKIL